MPRSAHLDTESLLSALRVAGPAGLAPDELLQRFPAVSRSTLNRRLKTMVLAGELKVLNAGKATRYRSARPYSVASVRDYLAVDYRARPVALFQESLLAPMPEMDTDQAERLCRIQALARPLDRRFLADFLIDLSWASSLLEGSTYSSLDTQALVQYGERNPEKPAEDALLALNHSRAIAYLWEHRSLSVETLCKVHALLTDNHQVSEAIDSDHFLPATQRGVPREYEEVNLARSAYQPPYRPGSGYVAQAFAALVEAASRLAPVQAAFYLMTRIPYLQVFANGNKRTARLAGNIPLLNAGLLPISFVDMRKADYIEAMAAFYEVGDVQLMQDVFVSGYVRSIIRSSDIPAAMKLSGFQPEGLHAELLQYVRSGMRPSSPAAPFLS